MKCYNEVFELQIATPFSHTESFGFSRPTEGSECERFSQLLRLALVWLLPESTILHLLQMRLE